MAANGTGPLLFIDDVIEVAALVLRRLLSAHIQPNAEKPIGRHFPVRMDNDFKTCCEELLKGKEMEYSSMTKSVTSSQTK